MGNDARRDLLADAGLALLAREGSRALTHRGVDREAGVPLGTTGNYHPTREQLVLALCERIMERLAPGEDVLSDLEARPRGVATYAAYMEDVVRRGLAAPETSLALFELRLLAARTPQAAELLGGFLTRRFREDVAYARARGLPGDARDVALLHHAIEGLLFDALTVSSVEGGDPGEVARELTARILAHTEPEADVEAPRTAP